MDIQFQWRYNEKSMRLSWFDYGSSGAYFVTICTKNREHYFGQILNNEMILNECGMMTQKFWQEIPEHFPFVVLDAFIIMPNHIHGILMIEKNVNNVETNDYSPLTLPDRHFLGKVNNHETNNHSSLRGDFHRASGTSKTIGSIIRGFKTGVTKWLLSRDVASIWQKNYYDHIIRTEQELSRIREYIVNNPVQWEFDQNNPENIYF